MGCRPSLGKAKIMRKSQANVFAKVCPQEEFINCGVIYTTVIHSSTKESPPEDARHSTEDVSQNSRVSSLHSRTRNKTAYCSRNSEADLRSDEM
ncbi:unnamed protein product [Blepharisma stoltei]|uniref:Uncharacterized protein n=1 Tax=Blepharisma stoltei TaxID=1481888 RepID=A0AAU9IL35_9CILI|nr:unnamed protein product [Blepharisma stoltei]